MSETKGYREPGYVFTVRLVVVDPVLAKAFVESLVSDSPVSGCQVRALSGGDVFDDRNRAMKLLGDIGEWIERKQLGIAEAEALLDRIEELEA